MTGGGGGGDDDDDEARAFAEATRGAKPLDPGARRRAPAGEARAGRKPPARAPQLPEGAPLVVETSGETIAALAPGIDRAQLRRLRAGDYPIEAEIDLHALKRAAVPEALERFIATAQARGARCVLVIHGRGNRSAPEGPVLRPAAWEWLTSSRRARAAVMALASARPEHGGGGATMVLLRRLRAP